VSRDGAQDAQKTGLTTRQLEAWVLPPDPDAECVACLDEVLATDANADDPHQPVLCLDEPPVQWLKATPGPMAATKPHGKRVADEDEGHGTASLGLVAEPWSGFRQATARERRTTVDGAIAVAQWLETRDVACAKVRRVCNHLNTPTKGAFSDAFPPARARADVKRMECCDTPTHGRWLNVAACEFSGLSSQCLPDRRIGVLPLLQSA
jgi:hypothetical protein